MRRALAVGITLVAAGCGADTGVDSGLSDEQYAQIESYFEGQAELAEPDTPSVEAARR
jgi:hypothetical protein